MRRFPATRDRERIFLPGMGILGLALRVAAFDYILLVKYPESPIGHITLIYITKRGATALHGCVE